MGQEEGEAHDAKQLRWYRLSPQTVMEMLFTCAAALILHSGTELRYVSLFSFPSSTDHRQPRKVDGGTGVARKPSYIIFVDLLVLHLVCFFLLLLWIVVRIVMPRSRLGRSVFSVSMIQT